MLFMDFPKTDNLAPACFTDEHDASLLSGLVEGNQTSFSLLYTNYVNDLFAYGIGLGCDRERLKDAIQDVFYKLYENRRKLPQIKHLKYYLLRMLKNQLLDMHRSNQHQVALVSDELTFSIKTTILDDLISEEEQQLLQTKVTHLLDSLTDRQREAVYLRFIQEMEYDEIATLLNMTPQASRKLIFRAIKRMRQEKIPITLFIFHLHACFH